MKLGVNLLLYDDSVTPAVLRRLKRVRELGADGVEVPVFAPERVDAAAIRRAADAAGLGLTVSGALPPGASWYGSAAARTRAERYIRGCIRVARELGADVICGPLYKTVGDMDESVTLGTQRKVAAAAMRRVAREAHEAGVVLALEPLNRFESNMINTAAQGIEFCRAAGGKGIGLLLDTFHMHIEEKDSAAAIRAAAAAGFLSHFHSAENDRGVAGTGQVHWVEVSAALRRVRYDGWVMLESFSVKVVSIRTAVSCWRPFFPSEERFVKEGLGFVRRLLSRSKATTRGGRARA